nr:MAG TPA: hypothetical protein [Caudoviricetes sp.]
MTHFTEECKLNIQTKYLLEDVLGGYRIITDKEGHVDVGHHYGKVTVVNSKENTRYTIEVHANVDSNGVKACIVRDGNWDIKSVFDISQLITEDTSQPEAAMMLYREIKRHGTIPMTIARITLGLYSWMLTGESKDPTNNYLPLAIRVDDENNDILAIANRLLVNTNGTRATILMEDDSVKDFVSFSIDKQFKVFKVLNSYGDVIDSRLFDDISELEGIITNNQAFDKLIMSAYHDFCEMTPEVFDARYSVQELKDEDEEMDLESEKSPFPYIEDIFGDWTMKINDYGYDENHASYQLTNESTGEQMLITFNHNVNHIAVEVCQSGTEDTGAVYSKQISTDHPDFDKGSTTENGLAISNAVDSRYRNLFTAVYLAEQHRKQAGMTIPLIIKPVHGGLILANAVAAIYHVTYLDKDSDNALPIYRCNFDLGYFGPCDAEGSFRHMTSIEGGMMPIQGAYSHDAGGIARYLEAISDIYDQGGNDAINKKYGNLAEISITKACKQIEDTYIESVPRDKGILAQILKIVTPDISDDSRNLKGKLVTNKSDGSKTSVEFIAPVDAMKLFDTTTHIKCDSNGSTIKLPEDKDDEPKSFFDLASYYKFEKSSDDEVTITIKLSRLQAEQLEEFIKH